MVDKTVYNDCMRPYITGSGKTPEGRKLDFCTGAKVCSGKASTDEEAIELCKNAPPKEPKVKKARGKCKIDVPALAACIIEALGDSEITPAVLGAAISGCTGQKTEKPKSSTTFLGRCIKELTVTGGFMEQNRLQQVCIKKAKEEGYTH